MEITFITDWIDCPDTMTFDELLVIPDGNYTERFGMWYITLPNGVYYKAMMDEDTGRKCGPLEVLDKCAMRGFR